MGPASFTATILRGQSLNNDIATEGWQEALRATGNGMGETGIGMLSNIMGPS